MLRPSAAVHRVERDARLRPSRQAPGKESGFAGLDRDRLGCRRFGKVLEHRLDAPLQVSEAPPLRRAVAREVVEARLNEGHELGIALV
jgi:hypothetical protein